MAFLIATLLLVLLSHFLGPLEYNTPSTPDEHSRPRSNSTASTTSDVKCDSGYASEDEQPDHGQYLTRPHSMHSLTKSFTDDVRPSELRRSNGSNGGHFAISERKLLYGIITLLLMYIIDMKLLVLPFFALVLAVVIASVFTPLVDVEHIFDPSAFRIDWMAKEKTAPMYVDQASSTTAPQTGHADTHDVASTPPTPEYVDQKISTTTQDGQNSSSQIVHSIPASNTSAQTGRSKSMQDRIRRPKIHHSQRVLTSTVDDVVYETDRSNFPSAKDFKIEQNEQKAKYNEETFMCMPAPQPGSVAFNPGYNGDWSLCQTALEHFKWAETAKKWIYVSPTVPGSWLIVTPQGNYVCQWHASLHVWWCEDHGFGFNEISPEDVDEETLETCRSFAGDINKPTPDMIGPDRTAKNIAGPYWHEAVAAHWKWCASKPEEKKEQAGATSQKKKAARATKQKKKPAGATRQKGSLHKQDFNFSAPQHDFNFSAPQDGLTFPSPQQEPTFAPHMEMDTKMEMGFDLLMPQPKSRFDAPPQSGFTFESPHQAAGTDGSWEQSMPQQVPVMPVQGQRQW
jgi:hypothetical protein